MLAESHLQVHSQSRLLRDEEKAILTAMLSNRSDFHIFEEKFYSLKVSDMHDGGMGGVKFISSDDERRFGMTLVEADYTDTDGMGVSIAINVDDKGDLYEMDFWKTDFSPLDKYPEPESVKIRFNDC